MSFIPQYSNRPLVCEHVFCDNRVNRAHATHRVTQVFDNGKQWQTLVCSEHLNVMRKVLHDNDFVEAL